MPTGSFKEFRRQDEKKRRFLVRRGLGQSFEQAWQPAEAERCLAFAGADLQGLFMVHRY
jgi:hypothetical protein